MAKKAECQAEQDHAVICFIASQAALVSLGSSKRSAVFSGEQSFTAGLVKSLGLSSRDYALLVYDTKCGVQATCGNNYSCEHNLPSSEHKFGKYVNYRVKFRNVVPSDL
eukprot:1579744-Amphidinium_carterae.1